MHWLILVNCNCHNWRIILTIFISVVFIHSCVVEGRLWRLSCQCVMCTLLYECLCDVFFVSRCLLIKWTGNSDIVWHYIIERNECPRVCRACRLYYLTIDLVIPHFVGCSHFVGEKTMCEKRLDVFHLMSHLMAQADCTERHFLCTVLCGWYDDGECQYLLQEFRRNFNLNSDV